ncbi:MAG: C-GCAxxG-C-C family protein [Anaerolineae bacterium]|nr:C-GCAxxG-C-C family protein [Anaerolineae bacterium]
MEDGERMLELRRQGFYCSQILMKMGLELQGKNNPDLMRVMQSLAGGLGFSGEICGALTGGACLLGLYAGKGLPEEQEDPRLLFMIEDLVKWFKAGFGEQYGGITCDRILEDSPKNQMNRCPGLVAGTYQKVKELLVENGFDLTGNIDG